MYVVARVVESARTRFGRVWTPCRSSVALWTPFRPNPSPYTQPELLNTRRFSEVLRRFCVIRFFVELRFSVLGFRNRTSANAIPDRKNVKPEILFLKASRVALVSVFHHITLNPKPAYRGSGKTTKRTPSSARYRAVRTYFV